VALGHIGAGSLFRSVSAVGIGALAFKLMVISPSQSAETTAGHPLSSHQTVPVVEVGKPVANDASYFLTPFMLADQPALKQSVFLFIGRTNSGNLKDTFAFGSGAPGIQFYDNYIVGGAYQRDFFQFNGGLLVGAEVGLANRFGHYRVCCDAITYSDSLLQSLEVWGGASFRYEGVELFDTVRIAPGFVFGLSAVSSPIGQEALHQIDHAGDPKVLFYLGFDLTLSLASLPNTELVFRVHHRSGGYGTLGAIKEGNNANVIGIRQRF
jgi:hypothetical protein